MGMPRCSVIIPTRDRPELLVRTTLSALLNTPNDSEIIVVDDAGAAAASDALAEIDDVRLRVITCDASGGYGGSPARNVGAQHARGAVLMFLDDDDELLPGYCDLLLGFIVPTGADFGFGLRQFQLTMADGKTISRLENRKLPDGFVPHNVHFKRKTFPFSAGFWIARDAYDTVGPLSESLTTNSDTEYSCRLYSAKLRGWHCAKPAVKINCGVLVAADQRPQTTKLAKSEHRAAAFKEIAEKHNIFLRSDSRAAEFVYIRWIKHAFRSGKSNEVYASILQLPHVGSRARLLAFCSLCAASRAFRRCK